MMAILTGVRWNLSVVLILISFRTSMFCRRIQVTVVLCWDAREI
jgi:hypothetical protein